VLTAQCAGRLDRRLKLKLDQKFRTGSEQGVLLKWRKNIKPVSFLRKNNSYISTEIRHERFGRTVGARSISNQTMEAKSDALMLPRLTIHGGEI
jgi:hypothetical protein